MINDATDVMIFNENNCNCSKSPPSCDCCVRVKGPFFPIKGKSCNVIRNWKISEKNGRLNLLWSILKIISRSGTSHLLSFVFVSSSGSRLYSLDFLHVLFSCWSFPFTCTWIFAELANILNAILGIFFAFHYQMLVFRGWSCLWW